MRVVATLLVMLSLLAASAHAQTSSGRHRAERSEPAPEQVGAVDDRTEGWDYFIGIGAGLATAGDVARIRAADVSGILWEPLQGDPFASHNMLLTLDENVTISASLGRRLARRWWLRLDASSSRIDLAAEARVGEGVQEYLWDRLSFFMATACLEFRLVDQPSYPYLLAGAGVTRIGDEGHGDWAQTLPTYRFGAGYEQQFLGQWAFRFEIRDMVIAMDLDDYDPPVVGDLVPDFTLEDRGPVHVFELLLTLKAAF